jgi:phosphatidylserine/phosphatidylglycerophosphate/cardiolipin synthase-like enzyme
VAAIAGCGPVASASSLRSEPSAPLLGPAPAVQVGLDSVMLLRSGEATFTAIRKLIDEAHVSVHIEVYEFGRADLAGSVIAAHDRGVDVTVIDDPSEMQSAATMERLRAAGVDVEDYPIRRLMIDHVKLLVVDGAAAVVGGINWGVASAANHDYDALVRGPVVTNLDRVFMRDLVTCGSGGTVPDEVRDPLVLVASTLPGTEIRPLALELINDARRALDLELFVITDTGVVRALVAAHARGVAVHVLLDPSQRPSDPSFAALRNVGVDVRWYHSRGELLHAKAVVADGRRVLFGSANWSGGGFARNHELDIELIDASHVAAQMLAQMSLDWGASG